MSVQLEIKKWDVCLPWRPTIFHDVSFSIEQGQVFCILGPNGAGKSTLLNCLANLFTLQSGEILLPASPCTRSRAEKWRSGLGTCRKTRTPPMAITVRDFVVMGRAPYISTMQLPKRPITTRPTRRWR